MTTRAERRRAARRRPLPGFPIEEPFTEPQDVWDYLAGEGQYGAEPGKILCLLCGKAYRSVGIHLRTHDISPDEYRDRYGLPWSIGLASPDCREAYRQHTLGMLADGYVPPVLADPSIQARARSAARRPRAPYRGKINNFPPPDPVRIADEVWDEYLARVGSGRAPSAVTADEDMPGGTTVVEKRQADPVFARRYDEAVDALPFDVLAEAGSLGPAFDAECQRLRDQGMIYRDIAAELGVSTMTVFRHLDRRPRA
jgi:hypothetical protein